MRILLTNDDGISAPGLAVAEEIAADARRPRRRGLGRRPRLRAVGRRPLRLLRPADAPRAARAPPLRRRGLARRLRARRACTRSSRTARPTWSSPGSTAATTSPRTRSTPAPSAARMEGGAARRPRRSRSRSTSARPPPAARPLRRRPRPRRRRSCAGSSTPPAWPTGPYAVFYNVNFPPVPADGGARHPRHLPGPPRARRPSACCRTSRRTAGTFLWLTHGHGNADTPARLGLRANATTASSP